VHDEGALNARADVVAAVLAAPRHRLHRLQVDVLLARREIGLLVDRVGFREPSLDRARLAVQFEEDVLLGMDGARELTLVVQSRRTRHHRFFGIEDGG
jgi:hypothetical protein